MTALTSKIEPTFAELGVRDEIVRALTEKGIEHAFAIQELTLPMALAGDDVIGQARTGMGKTLAFGVPLLQRITDGVGVRALNGTPAGPRRGPHPGAMPAGHRRLGRRRANT